MHNVILWFYTLSHFVKHCLYLLPFMRYFGNSLFFADFSNYTLILFVIIGFVAGFYLKINSQKGKNKFTKMEKEAESNHARIAVLKEKIEILEKENNDLGGPRNTK